MANLSVSNNEFYLGDEQIQLISGAIHYFRIVPQYWEDRLLKLKAAGFNCVETYVPWNLHEPKEGQYNFEGLANIEEFIRIAGRLDLHVIVRPTPYICAEWELGGLPSWILKDRNMRLRSYYEPFLEKVDNYFDELLKRLKPLQTTNGGPIIAMQVENEYGSYGNDTKYLEYLKDSMIDRGIDVLLFTSDGPTDFMLQGGTIPGTLATVNFGSRPEASFDLLRKYFPDSPNMVMEFWNGWFDHWGEEHHTRDPQDTADTFEHMLSRGDSVNFYMFHGGTNFGFYNGANHGGKYEPTVTSYDYDCPISETGDLTPKFHLVRDAVSKHKDLGELVLPEPIPKIDYGKVNFKESINLFDALLDISSPIERANPESMEDVGQDYGFILYRTQLTGPKGKMPLSIKDVGDRALIFIDKEFKGIIDRWDNKKVDIEVPKEGAQLDILVENMGRINYGPLIRDHKGVTDGVLLGQQYQYGWEIYSLPMTNLDQLKYKTDEDRPKDTPAFFRGTFEVDKIGDTFAEFAGWKKGIILINGFNIGRYWEIGPQETLYIPGPLLKEGENEIVIFELHEPDNTEIALIDEHKLG